ncbi:MAG: hypothetical protein HPY58_04740 [Firmicutes bacterium]|nr:hypothetical protein [Bacillota bacterium]
MPENEKDLCPGTANIHHQNKGLAPKRLLGARAARGLLRVLTPGLTGLLPCGLLPFPSASFN